MEGLSLLCEDLFHNLIAYGEYTVLVGVGNSIYVAHNTSNECIQAKMSGYSPKQQRFSSVLYKNSIYNFGGTVNNESDEKYLTASKIDLVLGNQTRLDTQGERPLNRYFHTSAVHNGKVYILGGKPTASLEGRTASESLRNCVAFFAVHALNLATLEWTVESKGSEDPSQFHSNELPMLWGHTLCSFQNFFLMFGGICVDSPKAVAELHSSTSISKFSLGNDRPALNGTLFIWSMQNGQWKNISSSSTGHSPSARAFHSSVMHDNLLILFGGVDFDFGGSVRHLYDCWCWNSDNGQWSMLCGLPFAVPKHLGILTTTSACVNGDNLLVYFGNSRQKIKVLHMFSFNLLNYTWSKVFRAVVQNEDDDWISIIETKSEVEARPESEPTGYFLKMQNELLDVKKERPVFRTRKSLNRRAGVTTARAFVQTQAKKFADTSCQTSGDPSAVNRSQLEFGDGMRRSDVIPHRNHSPFPLDVLRRSSHRKNTNSCVEEQISTRLNNLTNSRTLSSPKGYGSELSSVGQSIKQALLHRQSQAHTSPRKDSIASPAAGRRASLSPDARGPRRHGGLDKEPQSSFYVIAPPSEPPRADVNRSHLPEKPHFRETQPDHRFTSTVSSPLSINSEIPPKSSALEFQYPSFDQTWSGKRSSDFTPVTPAQPTQTKRNGLAQSPARITPARAHSGAKKVKGYVSPFDLQRLANIDSSIGVHSINTQEAARPGPSFSASQSSAKGYEAYYKAAINKYNK